LSATQNLFYVIVLVRDGDNRRIAGATEVVAASIAQLSKKVLHRVGRLEREPCVYAILRKLSWQTTKDETTKYATISWGVPITLTVCEAPRSEIERSKVRSKVPVTTRQGYGIAKNSATDSVPCREEIKPPKWIRDPNLPGQRPAPSTTGFVSSACKPT
jgi:hypothetical protein